VIDANQILDRIRSMSLRARIAALTAGAVAIAVLIVSLGAWFLVQRELRSEVDEGLIRRASVGRARGVIPPEPDASVPVAPPTRFEQVFERIDNAVQVFNANGAILLRATSDFELPVTDRDRGVAAGVENAYLRDARVAGVHVRMMTAQLSPGIAVQLVRDLTEVDGTLRGLAVVLSVLAALGVAGAAGAGLAVARRAVRPVERLTGAAEHVARTKELSARIEDDRDDELGRLARAFNEMLQALESSREQQRRLIADASHELRTPLTSLRTNVEVLSRVTDMDPRERERLLADLRTELEELSTLVAELVDLATEQRDADFEPISDVNVGEIVASAVDRTHRRTGRTINVYGDGGLANGRPLALERAITNMLDNAVKWSPPEEPIDLTVSADGAMIRVSVRDRGPGIPPDDRPFVFDRFFRSLAARSMPGSGLGLAIVKDVVESHGGRAWVDEAPGGGAVVAFEIPTVSAGPVDEPQPVEIGEAASVETPGHSGEPAGAPARSGDS
jgi:two-component system sensor histidine kinase MprB